MTLIYHQSHHNDNNTASHMCSTNIDLLNCMLYLLFLMKFEFKLYSNSLFPLSRVYITLIDTIFILRFQLTNFTSFSSPRNNWSNSVNFNLLFYFNWTTYYLQLLTIRSTDVCVWKGNISHERYLNVNFAVISNSIKFSFRKCWTWPGEAKGSHIYPNRKQFERETNSSI